MTIEQHKRPLHHSQRVVLGACALAMVALSACSQNQSSLEMPTIAKEAGKVLSKEQQKQAISDLSQQKVGGLLQPAAQSPSVSR